MVAGIFRKGIFMRNNNPKGNYVYAWFKDDEPIPFYIGRGVDDRQWREHFEQRNYQRCGKRISAECEKIRKQASKFTPKVVCDNLTDQGAKLLETVLINFLSETCGFRLANRTIPSIAHRNQETLPLEIKEVKKLLCIS
jgi:hypothetical protein